jgi:hypothetical protein
VLVRLSPPIEIPRDGLELVEGELELGDVGPQLLFNLVRADGGVDSLLHSLVLELDSLLKSHRQALLDLLIFEASEHVKQQLHLVGRDLFAGSSRILNEVKN